MKNKNKSNDIKDKNQTTKKSKTTQLNADENFSLNTAAYQSKLNSDNSPTKKTKEEKEKQYFISRIREINENFKNIQKSKNLIIDTRKTNLINSLKNPRFNYIKYRHKKYQIHKFPFRTEKSNESYEKNNNINYYYNDNNSVEEENLTLEQKVKNMKYQFIKCPISGYIPNFALTYSHLPHRSVGNSLYTVLTMRKNQFMDVYDQSKEKEKAELPKLKQMQFLVNNNNSPMSSYYGRKGDYRKYVDLLEQPFSYISLLNDDYTISEKMRFQKIMDKLNKVKKCIEENPDNEFEIVKEFILSIGLYDLCNLDIDKLNNFLNFIKSDFIIDPSKNIKENVYNILNKNKIYKPPISNALNCLNEEYLLNEMQKRRNLIKHKKIGEFFNTQNNNVHTELKSSITIKNKNISNTNDKMKNNTLSDFIEENKNLSLNKKMKSKTINNNKYKQRPLEHKGLCIDLKRQQEINLYEKRKELDLIKSPKTIIDMIKKEINIKDKNAAKTHYNWCGNIYKNKRLYGAKRQENAEYNEVKKKNMLTEYICLMKAKNNMKLSDLKKKYKL